MLTQDDKENIQAILDSLSPEEATPPIREMLRSALEGVFSQESFTTQDILRMLGHLTMVLAEWSGELDLDDEALRRRIVRALRPMHQSMEVLAGADQGIDSAELLLLLSTFLDQLASNSLPPMETDPRGMPRSNQMLN